MWTPSASSVRSEAAGTRRLTQLSLLLAAAVVIWLLESMLLPALPLPGAKFGFANVITLLLIAGYGFWESVSNVALRVLVGSLLTGTLLGPPFLLAFTAGIAAAAVMAALYRARWAGLSLVGVSVAGSVTHILVQLLLAALVTGTWLVWLQLPWLLLVGALTGCFNGVVCWLVARRVFAGSLPSSS